MFKKHFILKLLLGVKLVHCTSESEYSLNQNSKAQTIEEFV